jgi:hypothetical protein
MNIAIANWRLPIGHRRLVIRLPGDFWEEALREREPFNGSANRQLAFANRQDVGTEGEIRTLETSLEDSHVSSYITSA